jgi:hypothetical protein
MVERGTINIGLMASIVGAILIGYLLITLLARVSDRRRAAPAPPPAPAPKRAEPIGYKAATAPATETAEKPEPDTPEEP